MSNDVLRAWRTAFSTVQFARMHNEPVTPQMENRLYQASVDLYDAETHHARIAHVGQAVAAQCAAKEGT